MRILTSITGSLLATSLEEAIDMQLNAGIDVITDGQTSGNIIEIFASKIGGIKTEIIGERKTHTIAGALAWPEGGITAHSQKCARAHIAQRMRLLQRGEQTGRDIKLKGIVTGPYTLMQNCKNTYYKSEMEVAFAFAGVLNKELLALQDVTDVLQVDEPAFYRGVPDYAYELFENVVRGVNKEIILHAHARRNGKDYENRELLQRDLEKIAGLPVQVLGFDFAANGYVLDSLAKIQLSKKLNLGCIRTDVNYLPAVSNIVRRIKHAAQMFGNGKIAYVTPDCGMRLKQPHIANEMMQRVVAARDLYYQ